MQPFSHAENTPPADVRGRKQAHSPWSAPRNRKRQATVKAEPAPLAIISEDYSSPPKRRNGATGWGVERRGGAPGTAHASTI